MGHIIASGGGEIGRPGYPIETLKMDIEVINLTNKKSPNVLFIPTASGDSEPYCNTVDEYFGKKHGCTVDSLLLVKNKYTEKEMSQKVEWSDIVYVGGGNSLKLMNKWRATGFDKILEQHYRKGKLMYGLSAGSICWFEYGGSFAKRFSNTEASLIRVKGMGFIKYVNCPHYDMASEGQTGRKQQFKELLKKYKGIGIANDECCAIEIKDNKYRIIRSKETAKAYKVYWKNKEFHEIELINTNEYREIYELEET